MVSNNSAAAVRAYLDKHNLARYVVDVSCRTEPDPTLLKPHPHLLRRAADLLTLDIRDCALASLTVPASKPASAHRSALAFVSVVVSFVPGSCGPA